MKLHAYIDGKRLKTLEKLSPKMWELLFEAQQLGRAVYCTGKLSTRRALEARGLMNGWALTDAGRHVLRVEWKEPEF